ncbi:hypothetical protein RHGRI_038696 [Rhododendron griersonianum]|uniref:Uncharacterized protein n=1 Tax=Rhododendron griersonianum TaxID=479676 RepID=A0AAV6HJB8_9ERIC|nr:hypothetical protein RHGRI_038696 [Rhododendron griersonianum]
MVSSEIGEQGPEASIEIVEQGPMASIEIVEQGPEASIEIVEQGPEASSEIGEQGPKASSTSEFAGKKGLGFRRPPDPHGEKNPSPTFNTLSTNGQITMEMGGQNSEPNEFLPDSFEDPNFRNTGNGSIAEFEKTSFHDSLPGHCHDADICFPAVYSETDAAGGSSKWTFPLEGRTTQSIAYPNHNALVFPQSQIASTEVLNQNMGSSEDRRDLLASQVEAYPEGHVSESSNLTFPACSDAPVATILHTMPTIPHTIPHLTGGSSELMFQQKNQSTQFAAYPNPNGLVDPQHQMATTQKISENMRSLEDWRNLLAPQKEPLP